MKSAGTGESAAEERQRKLLEYLAAKGKLKPPNPKPYLRDRTNCTQGIGGQTAKAGTIVHQKENLHVNSANSKSRPAPPPKTSTKPPFCTSNATVTQPRCNAPQKPLAKVSTHPSRSSFGKAHFGGSSRQQERLGSAPSQRFPSALGGSKPHVIRTRKREETVSVCSLPALTNATSVSKIRDLPSRPKHAHKQTLGGCNVDKTKPTEGRVLQTVTRAQNPGYKKSEVPSCVLGTALRNGTAPRSTSGNGQCRPMEQSKTPSVSAPPRPPWKAHVPFIPPSRKVEDRAVCKTRPSGKLQTEIKASKVKPGAAAVKAGISTSAKTWSMIKAERANMTKPSIKPAPTVTVMKKSATIGPKSRSKAEGVDSTVHKCKDPVPLGHTIGIEAHSTFAIPPYKGALPSTPALGPASMPPRRAATEGKVNQDSMTLSAKEIRSRRLEEWKNSKGKAYKRPPMTLPPKKPPKVNQRLSFWACIEEEDDLNSLAEKITKSLSECLRLIEEGFPAEPLQSTLSSIPQAEKFANYWICRARLLERDGTFDVIGLYEQAVRAGAMPIEAVRETIFDIMRKTNKRAKVTFGPLPGEVPSDPAESCKDLPSKEPEALPNCYETNEQHSPNILTRHWTGEQGSSLKFQIAPLPRVKERAVHQDWRLLTPVRRSLRIERAVARYPETVREHDTVVASLNDLLDADENSCLVYRANEALPQEVDSKIRAL
ncbi:cytoskeleton-associated protein 2-like [Ambystoma mexicanum]|uniref:cytoskeleton-associated protein 2-like n=1 Tax=Ambystoma mexicanum TaxID=8296 RepID=UPI0037E8BD90